MAYNYPFFNFPSFRRYYVNYYGSPPIVKQPLQNSLSGFSKPSYTTPNANNSFVDSSLKNNSKNANTENSSSSKFGFLNNLFHQEDRGSDEACFDILGLKLYYDDILLMSLIFFLYKEDVKDQYLFVALVLLLLS